MTDKPMHPRRLEHPDTPRPKASRKDVDELLVACWDQGWWIVRAGNQHFKCFPPDENQRMVPIPATPSGYRTLNNKRSQLRRFGLQL